MFSRMCDVFLRLHVEFAWIVVFYRFDACLILQKYFDMGKRAHEMLIALQRERDAYRFDCCIGIY